PTQLIPPFSEVPNRPQKIRSTRRKLREYFFASSHQALLRRIAAKRKSLSAASVSKFHAAVRFASIDFCAVFNG
ncbi:MAG: hypothetical protein ACREQW_08700, partial [Candidatus Binatia bacterium]